MVAPILEECSQLVTRWEYFRRLGPDFDLLHYPSIQHLLEQVASKELEDLKEFNTILARPDLDEIEDTIV